MRRGITTVLVLALLLITVVNAATPSFGDVQCIGGVCTFFSNGGITSSNYQTAYDFYTDGDSGSWNLKDTNTGSCRYCYYRISTDTYTLGTSGASCSAFDASYSAPDYVGYLTGVAWYNSSKGWWDCYAVHINSGSAVGVPVSDFNYNVPSNSAYYPVTVLFSDNSTLTPTSWNWTVSGNATVVTTRNLTYNFTAAGTYTITHGAANEYGSSISSKEYTVKNYVSPTCGYNATSISGSSPYNLQLYDTSTGDPTSYLWVIDEEDQPWIYVSPSKYNYIANPAVTISGTGVGYILHQVTNPAGTSACALLPFNISGVAPTPSPTPAIPFPNQTGICQYSSITLGSGGTESFERYFNLNRPDGSVMSDYYASGARAYVTGTSYTSQLGTYIYNQYNASEELMYRSSYNVIDCQVIPTVTHTPIPTQTLIQTFPTVTGTLSPYWNTTVIPTVQPYSTIPSSLPSLSEGALNQTHTEEILVDFSPALATYINLVKGTLTDANNFFMYPVILALSPVANIANMLVYVLALFTQYFSTFTPMFTLPYSVFTNLFNAMHWKLKGVITFGLIIDTILMVYYLKRGRF